MYEDYYGHDPVMVTQMPTLCEVAYNKTDWPPEPTWSDTVPAIPYRHSFTKKQDQRSPTQSQHHQDYKSACGADSLHGMNMAEVAMASPSLYRHSMYSPTAVAGRTMCDRVTTVGYRTPMSYAVSTLPVNTKHLYNICKMLDQRRRRWADVLQMFYKSFACTWLNNFIT